MPASVRRPRDYRMGPLPRALEPTPAALADRSRTRSVNAITSYARQAPPVVCLRCSAPIARSDPRTAVSVCPAGGPETAGVACEFCAVEIARAIAPARTR